MKLLQLAIYCLFAMLANADYSEPSEKPSPTKQVFSLDLPVEMEIDSLLPNGEKHERISDIVGEAKKDFLEKKKFKRIESLLVIDATGRPISQIPVSADTGKEGLKKALQLLIDKREAVNQSSVRWATEKKGDSAFQSAVKIIENVDTNFIKAFYQEELNTVLAATKSENEERKKQVLSRVDSFDARQKVEELLFRKREELANARQKSGSSGVIEVFEKMIREEGLSAESKQLIIMQIMRCYMDLKDYPNIYESIKRAIAAAPATELALRLPDIERKIREARPKQDELSPTK